MRGRQGCVRKLTGWRPIKSAVYKTDLDLGMPLYQRIEGQCIGSVSKGARLIVCGDDTNVPRSDPFHKSQIPAALSRSTTASVEVLKDFDPIAASDGRELFAALTLNLRASGPFVVPVPALPDVDDRYRHR